tara:strand:- start:1577 stop:2311 length:735 start_codon:yes stop_codon:yes gene_type:complete
MENELKSANSVKTGKKFKEKRAEIGLSIDQISKKLFINKDYLIAIESGDYSIFPSEIFARAYFKKYANFLNINSEFPGIFELKIEKKHKKISSEIRFTNTLNINIFYAVITFIFIATVLSFYFFNQTLLKKAKSKPQTFSPEDIELVAKSVSENNYEAIEDNDSNILILEFIGECWVELYLEEKLIETQIFNEGDIYSRKILLPFKIIIGNADSIKGTYNGEEIDFISNANRLTRVNTINFSND